MATIDAEQVRRDSFTACGIEMDSAANREAAFIQSHGVDLIRLVHTVCGGNFAQAVREADKLNALYLEAMRGA